MPDYVRNRVTVEPAHLMDEVEERFFTDGVLDFDKVIPMPESLMLPSGSITADALTEHCRCHPEDTALAAKIGFVRDKPRKAPDELEEEFQEEYGYNSKNYPLEKLGIRTLSDLGRAYIESYKKYGYDGWYDWRTRHWGTKWGATGFSLIGDSMTFDTAWDMPEPVIKSLSAQVAGATLSVAWAHEDLGGYFESKYRAGRLVANDKGTYEDACELWGVDPGDAFRDEEGGDDEG